MLQPGRQFEIIVNGRPVLSEAGTLGALLEEHELLGAKVATALNGHFVPAGRRATTHLNPGDRIEIVSARQGG